ncbi:hypothetical protein Y032_0026g1441 [Ancylostoma ceylanicum]|uniref:Uncharacterized protein n=1 Tax=Ancylostoma ceylanicum TaxID=53326 RepID=A0A016UVA2_9BILA|nr:hypothetical protein Y032_0026g1441 [Ancylostoma ceylanicum]
MMWAAGNRFSFCPVLPQRYVFVFEKFSSTGLIHLLIANPVKSFNGIICGHLKFVMGSEEDILLTVMN